MTAIHVTAHKRPSRKFTALATTGASKTLVFTTMIVMMVMMNDLGFSLLLVSLTGFVICRVIGIHLVGSVVSCFLVHKELLAGP